MNLILVTLCANLFLPSDSCKEICHKVFDGKCRRGLCRKTSSLFLWHNHRVLLALFMALLTLKAQINLYLKQIITKIFLVDNNLLCTTINGEIGRRTRSRNTLFALFLRLVCLREKLQKEEKNVKESFNKMFISVIMSPEEPNSFKPSSLLTVN